MSDCWKKRLIWLTGILLIIAVVYGLTAARTIVGYGDSDEIITVGYTGAVAHPPGYPWMVGLVFAVTHLLGFLPPSWAAHLLAGWLHLFTLAGVALAGWLILDRLWPATKYELAKQVAVAAGVISLAFSALFWLYSSVIEVASLNDLLAVWTATASLVWYLQAEKGRLSWRWLMATGLLVGLGLNNVQSFVLLLPVLGIIWLHGMYLIHRASSRASLRHWLVGAGLPLFVGLTSFGLGLGLLWLLNSRQMDFSWYFDANWAGLRRMILRQDYAGFIPEKGKTVGAYLASLGINYYVNGMLAYLGFMAQHFVYLPWLIGWIGIIKLFTRNWRWALLASGFWWIAGLWFGGRLGLPEFDPNNLSQQMEIGISHRQYLMGYSLWGWLMIVGYFALLLDLRRRLPRLSFRWLVYAVILAGLSFALVWSNRLMADKSQDQWLADYLRQQLELSQPDDVLICFSDITCFGLAYLQQVEDYRTDVVVLSKNNFYYRYFLQRHPQYRGFPDYVDNPFYTADLVSWNRLKRRVFILEPSGYYITYLGLEGNPFYLVPRGYAFQVTDQVPPELSEQPNYQASRRLLDQPYDRRDYIQRGMRDYLTHLHLPLGVLYAKMGYNQLAKQNLELAVALSPDYSAAQEFMEQLPGFAGLAQYKPGTRSPSTEQLLAGYHQLLEKDQVEEAYSNLLKAVFYDPLAIEPRWQLAQFYLQYIKKPLSVYRAKVELKNILRYHPDYQPAQKLLQQLEQDED